MKKTLALLLACCLLAGCSDRTVRYDDTSDSSGMSSHMSAYAIPKDSEPEGDPFGNTPNNGSSSESTSSSSSSSSKPQSSSSSSSSKPQNSSSSSSSKTQSSSSNSSATITNDYGRRAQEAWEVEFADEVFKLVNVERAKEGLPALKKMASLTKASTIRAWECLVAYDPNHKRPDGQSFSTALTEQGIKFSACGENIAAGQETPQQVVEEWMNSPGHRTNILSEKYEYLGVGFYYDYDSIGGKYHYYWAQDFCKLR